MWEATCIEPLDLLGRGTSDLPRGPKQLDSPVLPSPALVRVEDGDGDGWSNAQGARMRGRGV